MKLRMVFLLAVAFIAGCATTDKEMDKAIAKYGSITSSKNIVLAQLNESGTRLLVRTVKGDYDYEFDLPENHLNEIITAFGLPNRTRFGDMEISSDGSAKIRLGMRYGDYYDLVSRNNPDLLSKEQRKRMEALGFWPSDKEVFGDSSASRWTFMVWDATLSGHRTPVGDNDVGQAYTGANIIGYQACTTRCDGSNYPEIYCSCQINVTFYPTTYDPEKLWQLKGARKSAEWVKEMRIDNAGTKLFLRTNESDYEFDLPTNHLNEIIADFGEPSTSRAIFFDDFFVYPSGKAKITFGLTFRGHKYLTRAECAAIKYEYIPCKDDKLTPQERARLATYGFAPDKETQPGTQHSELAGSSCSRCSPSSPSYMQWSRELAGRRYPANSRDMPTGTNFPGETGDSFWVTIDPSGIKRQDTLLNIGLGAAGTIGFILLAPVILLDGGLPKDW